MGKTEEAFDKYFGDKSKKKQEPKEESKEEPKEEPKDSAKSQFKTKGKLAEKFGHLNLDPTKMKVGASRQRKPVAFKSEETQQPEKPKDDSSNIFDDEEVSKRASTQEKEIDELFDFDDEPQKTDKVEPELKPEPEPKMESKPKAKEPSPEPEKPKASSNIFDDSDDDDMWSSNKNITKSKLNNKDDDDLDSLFD